MVAVREAMAVFGTAGCRLCSAERTVSASFRKFSRERNLPVRGRDVESFRSTRSFQNGATLASSSEKLESSPKAPKGKDGQRQCSLQDSTGSSPLRALGALGSASKVSAEYVKRAPTMRLFNGSSGFASNFCQKKSASPERLSKEPLTVCWRSVV